MVCVKSVGAEVPHCTCFNLWQCYQLLFFSDLHLCVVMYVDISLHVAMCARLSWHLESSKCTLNYCLSSSLNLDHILYIFVPALLSSIVSVIHVYIKLWFVFWCAGHLSKLRKDEESGENGFEILHQSTVHRCLLLVLIVARRDRCCHSCTQREHTSRQPL